MPEDETQDRLRVGGWVPPYSRDGSGYGPPLRPGSRPALPRGVQRRALGPGPGTSSSLRPRLVLAAALALACATTAVVAGIVNGNQEPAPVAAQTEEYPRPGEPFEPLRPTGTISLLPPPSATTTSAYTLPTSRAAATVPPTHTRWPSKATPAPGRTARPAPPALVTGATVGLESADRPGNRVRHRDFRGRLDPVGAGSSDLDRADARFTVRRGRANANCFSLESVNFPGYYLRHRNFEIRLDRSDRTELFDQDATFCTVTIRQGAALALRSLNYPVRYVVADRTRLVLRETTAEGATALLPRSPL
ncbi:AbfB domain-containing protein [Actinoplanes sp. GCM10030250]|uniref:AbfB domain-containing protein n=1 Tax=Actinoplanes sp. GCM10030250 TaxID=3273376 RepID=UPI00361B3D40